MKHGVYIFCLLVWTMMMAGCKTGLSSVPAHQDTSPTSLQQSVETGEKSHTDNLYIGINSPVAQVSAKYAADAQRMLDDFYSAANMLPQEYVTAPFDPGPYMVPDYYKDTSYQLYDQWCYKAWGIDYYFYTWEEAAAELRNGKTLYEVLELAEESTSAFYNSKQCAVGVLYGLNGHVFGEARYDDGERKGTVFGVMAWYFWEQTAGPVEALVLTDDLMSALENEGFDLSQTKATSVAISGHSGGLYFDDGMIQRYYPQIMLSGQDDYPLSNDKFYSIEAFIDSLSSRRN